MVCIILPDNYTFCCCISKVVLFVTSRVHLHSKYLISLTCCVCLSSFCGRYRRLWAAMSSFYWELSLHLHKVQCGPVSDVFNPSIGWSFSFFKLPAIVPYEAVLMSQLSGRLCNFALFFMCSVEIVNSPGLDIFGQSRYIKKQYECVCPNCQRTLAASRFAPHLEKCMGMGRISSRIASRR